MGSIVERERLRSRSNAFIESKSAASCDLLFDPRVRLLVLLVLEIVLISGAAKVIAIVINLRTKPPSTGNPIGSGFKFRSDFLDQIHSGALNYRVEMDYFVLF